MTQRRCQGCGTFYDKKQGDCPNPDCGAEAYGFNKHLRTSALNDGLYKQAARAEAQKRR